MLLFSFTFRGRYRDDLERVRLPIIVLDRDVFALDEAMLMQMVAGFLVAGPILIVVDHPGRATRAARPMDQNALALAILGPEAADTAIGTPVRPFLLIETALLVERRGDLVAVPRAAFRKLLAAGQMERNAMGNG